MHLSRLFQRSVQMYGERPALALGSESPLKYRELDLRIRSLARWLRDDLGLQPGDRVLLAMKNCIEYAEALLAIWHARLCAVPINSKLHPREVEFILENSGAGACLSQGGLHESLRPITEALGVRLIDVQGKQWHAAFTVPGSAAHLYPSGADDELAWLFYTSGTTGRPKGVMLSHANLVSMALHFNTDVQPISTGDVLLHAAPMSHGGGLYGIPYMMHGGLQVVAPSGGFDEAELFGLFGRFECVSLFAAPTMVGRMVQYARKLHGDAAPAMRTGLRCILTGGAPFYVEDIKAAVACFGPRIAQMYGQGETPMTISALPAQLIARAVAEDDNEALASVGFAQTAVEIEILDHEGKPLPLGEAGEVVVRSPTVMLGYWKNPEATLQAVVDGGLRTGDVGRLDAQGRLHLMDRSKDVIISGGSNIYPREVEEALLRHPAVLEVSVIGVPDAEWGESVTAIVVRRDGMNVDADALDAACLESIARFKRPKRYVFVSSLPKNATGKVLKSELRTRFASPPQLHSSQHSSQ